MKKIKSFKLLLILFLIALIVVNTVSVGCKNNNGKGNSHSGEKEETLLNDFGGVLKTVYNNVTDSFYKSGNDYYKVGFNAQNTDLWYAEPEFAGKYIFICSLLKGKYLQQAKEVVKACIKAQREDGYLGCLPAGHELDNFSIWNQTFTILGLVEYYNATKDEEALLCAKKSFSNVEKTLKDGVNNGKALTDSINGGSQHISILLIIAKLFKATKDASYLNFADYIISQCKKEGFELLDFSSIFSQKSQKGIEMLIVYIGLSEIANVLDEYKDVIESDNIKINYSSEQIRNSVIKYWKEINATQIRNTGGATTGEWWQQNGNVPAQLKTDMAVNENCVSVGWVELTSILFEGDTKAEYLDAIEKTFFNAILGSVSTDGNDFAYYQGNYGKKEFATSGGMYKCCRTRGFNVIAELTKMIYKYKNDEIVPILYCENNYELEKGLNISCQTLYPQNGSLKYTIKNFCGKDKTLKIRIPNWCDNYTIQTDNPYGVSDNFINVIIGQGESKVTVNFEMEVKIGEYVINGEKCYDFNYGALLLVHDRSNGVSLKECRYDSTNEIIPVEKDWNEWNENKNGIWYLTQFTCGNLNLVDYASAGRANPELDLFKTYIQGVEQ